jgi:hypothetical protein
MPFEFTIYVYKDFKISENNIFIWKRFLNDKYFRYNFKRWKL